MRVDHDTVRTAGITTARPLDLQGFQEANFTGLPRKFTYIVRLLGSEPNITLRVKDECVGITHCLVRHPIFGDITGIWIEHADVRSTIPRIPDHSVVIDD